MNVTRQGVFMLAVLLCASPLVAATTAPPPPAPETVPLLDTWALAGLGVALAIAGAIASLRIKKKK